MINLRFCLPCAVPLCPSIREGKYNEADEPAMGAGGWGDFFATGDSLLPNWTPEVKGKNGEDCVRIGAQGVNEILQTLNTGTAELDGMALEKVCY